MSIDRIKSLTEAYDPELRFRPVTGAVGVFAAAWLAALSLFHYFTAALGPLEHRLHTGIHLAFVLSLIFWYSRFIGVCAGNALHRAGL